MQRKYKLYIACVLIFLILALIISLSVTWAVLAHENYSRWIKPGQEYKVNDRVYRMPDVPLKKGNMKVGRKDQKVLILSEEFLQRERDLLIKITNMFDENKITYWLSGGSLIGFAGNYKTFIPWDDDIDMHTQYRFKEYMFSTKFADLCHQHDLEIIQLVGQGKDFALREGAAVRLRMRNTQMPVCDIFFETEKTTNAGEKKNNNNGETMWGKLDGWNGQKLTFNKKEEWPKSHLFPIRKLEVDGMSLSVPNKYNDILTYQYGKNVNNEMVYVDPMFSHQIPYRFLFGFWKKR